MGRVLVVGKRSFLARRFLALTTVTDVVAISHHELARPGVFDDVECVVNFAIDSRVMHDGYAAEDGFDMMLAAKLPAHTRFVLPSTRAVYATEDAAGATETTKATGANAYGRNKLEVEARLRERLGERLTVLRLGWNPQMSAPSLVDSLFRQREAERVEPPPPIPSAPVVQPSVPPTDGSNPK